MGWPNKLAGVRIGGRWTLKIGARMYGGGEGGSRPPQLKKYFLHEPISSQQ